MSAVAKYVAKPLFGSVDLLLAGSSGWAGRFWKSGISFAEPVGKPLQGFNGRIRRTTDLDRLQMHTAHAAADPPVASADVNALAIGAYATAMTAGKNPRWPAQDS